MFYFDVKHNNGTEGESFLYLGQLELTLNANFAKSAPRR